MGEYIDLNALVIFVILLNNNFITMYFKFGALSL